jgi:hypothetical protein
MHPQGEAVSEPPCRYPVVCVEDQYGVGRFRDRPSLGQAFACALAEVSFRATALYRLPQLTGPYFLSQRDSRYQPRVARHGLPWEPHHPRTNRNAVPVGIVAAKRKEHRCAKIRRPGMHRDLP